LVFETLGKWIDLKKPDSERPPDMLKEAVCPREVIELPGINVELALSRIAGNWTLLKDLLRQFSGNYATVIDEIKIAIKDSRLDHAAHLAHTVKGVSGNIGANRLHQSAGELEKAISEGRMGIIEELLNDFRTALNQVMESIKCLNEVTRPDIETNLATSNEVSEFQKPDLQKIEPLLFECIRLMESDFPEAQNLILQLKDLLRGADLETELKRLESDMEAFNIDGALNGLKNIAMKLNLHLE